jgi:hypothetical protein
VHSSLREATTPYINRWYQLKMTMETIKLILELSYYVSAIALVIIAAFGLKQISVAKETRKISSKREAFNIAANQCNQYLDKIIPEINKLDQVIKDNDLKYFTKSKADIENGEIKLTSYLDGDALNKAIDTGINEIMSVTNLLEGFSLYFVSGVASEQVAFNTVGRTFVHSVKSYLPYYVPFSQNGAYSHTLSLFLNWNNRIESEKLQKEKAKIESKLKGSKSTSIRPIGTI